MLIRSMRHTRDDLALWQVLQAADNSHDVSRKSVAAQERVAKFVSANERCYAGVSWGKDSVVIAHLLWKAARHVPLVHLRPTNHNPDCDAVRDAYLASFHGQLYEEVYVDYSHVDRVRMTHQDVNRATDRAWFAAIGKCERQYGKAITGVRAAESMGRRLRFAVWGLESRKTLCPIGQWSTQDVFAYLAQNRLPVHPAYAMLGGGRWDRRHLRVAEIGDTHGAGMGRAEWEREYYGDIVARNSVCRNT